MNPLPSDLYRAGQVRELDRCAIERFGIPGLELMERAGSASFALLRRLWPEARRIGVLCGAGNNGGDGYVVARLALEAGLEATVLTLDGLREPGGTAALARERALGAAVPVKTLSEDKVSDYDLLVDALLGTGLAGAVEGAFATAVEWVNRSVCPVLALDIPSGLHADTGAVLGCAVKAEATVTFIGLKQGLLTGEGPERCGTLFFDSLGVPPEVYGSLAPAAQRMDGGSVTAGQLPPRARAAHKGTYGHVLVVGGEHGMAGAVRMAAEAAARVGAGLVSVATRAAYAGFISAARPELMAHGVEEAAALGPLLARATVVALGPGLGRGAWGKAMLGKVLESGRPLVVDADALNLLAGEPERREQWILTPHPGEAARLLGSSTAEVQRDRFSAAAALHERFGGVVLLKGAGTLVTDDSGTTVCTAGNPGMASGGMGDLLTGVIAGLLAQGLAPGDAARLGACVHGAAGDRAARAGGERGLLAGDLMEHLRPLVNPA